jgi:hypothetical protein
MEYSAKYRVSISTLRRRIKAGESEYQFTDGKYLLRDVSPSTEPMVMSAGSEVVAPPLKAKPQSQMSTPTTEVGPTIEKLLSEIKKAYMQILQEKEEQILLLRSEVSDLKTLVGVLEEQNGQLKQKKQEPLIGPDPKFELDLDL